METNSSSTVKKNDGVEKIKDRLIMNSSLEEFSDEVSFDFRMDESTFSIMVVGGIRGSSQEEDIPCALCAFL